MCLRDPGLAALIEHPGANRGDRQKALVEARLGVVTGWKQDEFLWAIVVEIVWMQLCADISKLQ